MIGEVWVCSGQSNMEWPVSRSNNAAQEIKQADHPDIRLFTVEHQISFRPGEDVEGSWQVCSPATIERFWAGAERRPGCSYWVDQYHLGRDKD